MLTVYAPAKINLVLEVLGSYDDGYHQIKSVVQTIDWCDVLSFELDRELSFECSEPRLEDDNQVMKAARLFQQATGCREGVKIRLNNNIPWGVGLGGGSSDAAATLLALNTLWETNFSPAQLAQLAAEVSSDAPLFIYGGTVLVEGRGEKVTPLPPLPQGYFVLHVPPLPRFPDKTGRLYHQLNARHFTSGKFTHAALEALDEGRMIGLAAMFNVFELVAFDAFPRLDEYWSIFEKTAGSTVHLAGSGPCLFVLLPEEQKAREICISMHRRGLACYVAASLPRGG